MSILKEWESKVKALSEAYDDMPAIINHDADPFNQFWAVAEAYTAEVERRLGIDAGVLAWWQYENEYGKNGLRAQMADGSEGARLKTLAQFERLLFSNK
jgi:hypothetical protein